MIAFTIAGWSGIGKTTLIERLIEGFRARGLRVAAVKKVPHGADLEPQGKDTARFRRAGAAPVFAFGAGELLASEPVASVEEGWRRVLARVDGEDVLLLEGLIVPGVPVIEVAQAGSPLKIPGERLAAVVGGERSETGRPHFATGAIDELLDFMEGYDGQPGFIEGGREDRAVE